MTILVAAGLLVMGAAVGLAQPTVELTIRLPREVNPETVTIATGIYGHGLAVGSVPTKKGVYDYAVEADRTPGGVVDRDRSADSLKLLIYCPGYRIVTATFTRAELNARQLFVPPLFAPQPFVPPLVKLPTTPLAVRLVNSAQQPLSGQTLRVSYDLMEAMRFFGYIDGSVPTLQIAIAKTNEKGAVTVEVPSFAEDPFFQTQKSHGEFQFSSEIERSRDNTLRPGSFSVQTSYQQPIIITKTLRGTLSGRLGEVFLQSHGLTGDLTPYIHSINSVPFSIRLDATTVDGRIDYNANLASDGTFHVELPPGKYDLVLMMLGPGFTLREKVSVQSGVVVQESKPTVITRNK